MSSWRNAIWLLRERDDDYHSFYGKQLKFNLPRVRREWTYLVEKSIRLSNDLIAKGVTVPTLNPLGCIRLAMKVSFGQNNQMLMCINHQTRFFYASRSEFTEGISTCYYKIQIIFSISAYPDESLWFTINDLFGFPVIMSIEFKLNVNVEN